ncbi:Chitobiosyldiphosphodolichol beta-mannosyltransferase [Geodia barretti]|uniref:Chitobiosyldiphosphodolichol beta-mannosyltransferase n=1 Tax=Geodia barretti TaxID=519541 RepID=A0AA35RUU1_GEOBA|nr:Chitobiosyldiphosphodolichol beta-mannosyltransferase [Geodia barretti]
MLGVFLISLTTFLILLLLLRWRCERGEGRVLVVVLGDMGRSPRMQYHCLSLLKAGYSVEFVGYGGQPSTLKYFLKVTFQTCSLLWVMLQRAQKSSNVILQVPPSIPTLFVCVLVCCLRNSRLIVDFHNYGHTLLALTLGSRHPLVGISRRYDEVLSRFAHSIICVSVAMKRDLDERLGVSVTVFHDRPPRRFKRADLYQKHK